MVILSDFWGLMSCLTNYKNKFRIVIASLPHLENCVCEIYYDHVQWAEISQESVEIMIQFYAHPSMDCWEFPLDVALEVLNESKNFFLGK